MNTPLSGINYFLDGCALILVPGLRKFTLIPVVMNFILFAGLFLISGYYFHEFNIWFAHYLPHWLLWLSDILWILFLISFLIMFITTFITIANILAAPFNSVLSEKVEFYLQGTPIKTKNLIENITDIPRTIGRQLAIISYFLPRAFLLLILFLIPFFQPIAAILWFLFNAWVIALTYLDYPADNHRCSWKETHLLLKQNRGLVLGFGISVLIASMIPILNLFMIPAAVSGATKLWLKIIR